MGLFNINCHEGKLLCDKNQYKETSFSEKLRLYFYLIVCSECRAYTAKNTKLSKAISSDSVHTVSAQEKNALKEKLSKALEQ